MDVLNLGCRFGHSGVLYCPYSLTTRSGWRLSLLSRVSLRTVFTRFSPSDLNAFSVYYKLIVPAANGVPARQIANATYSDEGAVIKSNVGIRGDVSTGAGWHFCTFTVLARYAASSNTTGSEKVV